MSNLKKQLGMVSRPKKNYPAMMGFEDDEMELSPEEKLRMLVFQPYIELHLKLQEAQGLVEFAREHVGGDDTFVDVICKKVVLDLRAAVSRFESETRDPEKG